MLIVCADDLGRDKHATDTCMECFRQKRITTASVMVFMKDSERAAALAINENLETGLHINLVLPFDGREIPESSKKNLNSAARFYRKGPWTQVVYNPLIAKAVASAFQCQLDEYRRLFGREPVYFNGHRHLHLSLNMIFGGVLPIGSAVRRGFTFYRGEKSYLNRFYRRLIDAWLLKRHSSTEAFFSLTPFNEISRLTRITNLAQTASVELMVHAWRSEEYAFLTGHQCQNILTSVRFGDYFTLQSAKGARS